MRWILIAGVAFVVASMTFVAGLGLGFGAGRLTAPKVAALEPAAYEPSGAGPVSLPAVRSDDLPAEFDLVWEAWGALEEDFYGDLPDTPDMAGGLVAGMLHAAQRETDSALDREQTANAVMAAVIGVLEAQKMAPPDVNQLVYGAIDGLTFQLNDDYTSLMDPESADIFNEGLSGSFEGIGAQVSEAEEGGVRIMEPFEGQPAWNAGLRRDDVILAVDDQDVTNVPLSEAIKLIRGPKGTTVTLLIRTPGQEPRSVEVVRDRIAIPVVEQRMLAGNVAYLRLGEFSTPSVRQVRDALRELLANDPVGLVLDLRGNPGGLLRSAVDVSSEFVPQGAILVERFKDGQEQTYRSRGSGLARETPLVVLVNEGSASASEILAGAVQDSGRGILIGETTFGKGSVQIPHQLSDGSLLRVTTALWFTPNGRQINGLGLTPDIELERTEEDYRSGQDPQLDRAIEYLLNNSQP